MKIDEGVLRHVDINLKQSNAAEYYFATMQNQTRHLLTLLGGGHLPGSGSQLTEMLTWT